MTRKTTMTEVFKRTLNEDGTAVAGGNKLFSIEMADKTFVVTAKSRGEAIVFLSAIVGRDNIVKSRDQLQQHFGAVVQVNRGTGDAEDVEVDDKDMAPAGGPPPLPNKA